jgi:hypothetical protein
VGERRLRDQSHLLHRKVAVLVAARELQALACSQPRRGISGKIQRHMLDMLRPSRGSGIGAFKEVQDLVFLVLKIVTDKDLQLAFGLRNACREQRTRKGAKEHKSGKQSDGLFHLNSPEDPRTHIGKTIP